MFKRITGAAVAAFALLSSSAWAYSVTLDLSIFESGTSFNDPRNINPVTNQLISGFRVSPRCHFDYFTAVGRPSGTSLTGVGGDFAGCSGGPPPPGIPPSYNLNYLGDTLPEASRLLGYIDFQGAAFDLLYLDIYRTEYGARFISSNGGLLDFPVDFSVTPEVYRVNFTGPQWENISWFTFSPGPGPGVPVGLVGNITLGVNAAAGVPEPGSLGLALSGLLVAGLLQRYKQRAR